MSLMRTSRSAIWSNTITKRSRGVARGSSIHPFAVKVSTNIENEMATELRDSVQEKARRVYCVKLTFFRFLFVPLKKEIKKNF